MSLLINPNLSEDEYKLAMKNYANERGVEYREAKFESKLQEDGTLEFRINGHIGTYGVRASDLARAIEANETKKKLKLVVNSFGGDIYEGFNLYGEVYRLIQEGWEVKMDIVGSCFSAATLPAVVCGYENISMTPVASFMVHETRAIGFINVSKSSFRGLYENVSKDLVKLDNKVLNLYSSHSRLGRKALQAYLEADGGNGTFFEPDELKNFFGIKGDPDYKKKGEPEKPEMRNEANGEADVSIGGEDVDVGETENLDPKEIMNLESFSRFKQQIGVSHGTV